MRAMTPKKKQRINAAGQKNLFGGQALSKEKTTPLSLIRHGDVSLWRSLHGFGGIALKIKTYLVVQCTLQLVV